MQQVYHKQRNPYTIIDLWRWLSSSKAASKQASNHLDVLNAGLERVQHALQKPILEAPVWCRLLQQTAQSIRFVCITDRGRHICRASEVQEQARPRQPPQKGLWIMTCGSHMHADEYTAMATRGQGDIHAAEQQAALGALQ